MRYGKLLLLAVLVFAGPAGCRLPIDPVESWPAAPEPPPAAVCPLDGEPAAEEEVARRVLAVVVDNHSQARPQAGLTQACLVYEVLAEGGITRFVAFYLHREAQVILPIRSARPYYLDWVLELDAALAHCGGTPATLTDIERMKVASLDEIARARTYYERHAGRKAPHNLRSSTELLRRAVVKLGYEYEAGRTPPSLFRFEPGPSWQGSPATGLKIAYGPSSLPSVAEYRYDAESGYYLRFQNGSPHTCATDTRRQVRARTVIVMYVRHTPIKGSPEGYLDLQLVGSGKATVFARGIAADARWSKKDRAARTVFTLADGSELVLEPGPIWIQVVPDDMKIEVTP